MDAVIPGHGSIGDAEQLRTRIAADRAYVETLRDGGRFADARVGDDAPLSWLPDVHDGQVRRLAGRTD